MATPAKSTTKAPAKATSAPKTTGALSSTKVAHVNKARNHKKRPVAGPEPRRAITPKDEEGAAVGNKEYGLKAPVVQIGRKMWSVMYPVRGFLSPRRRQDGSIITHLKGDVHGRDGKPVMNQCGGYIGRKDAIPESVMRNAIAKAKYKADKKATETKQRVSAC